MRDFTALQYHDENVCAHPLSEEEMREHKQGWIARSIDGATVLALGKNIDDIRQKLSKKGLTIDDVCVDTVRNEERLLRRAALQ